jgi:hypothetical protein
MKTRTAYMIRFEDGKYLAPRQSTDFNKSGRTTFEKARIFSSRTSVEQAAVWWTRTTIVEVLITEPFVFSGLPELREHGIIEPVL